MKHFYEKVLTFSYYSDIILYVITVLAVLLLQQNIILLSQGVLFESAANTPSSTFFIWNEVENGGNKIND